MEDKTGSHASKGEQPGATARSDGAAPSPYISGWRLAVVITCLFFGAFLIALDTNIVNVAVPKISSEFHALDDVAWYGTAYLLTITAFQPIYGSLYKYFRTDVVYRLSILMFEVGTVLCAAATSSKMFIVGRAIAGFGAAGVLQGALTIISQVIELEKRPLYMGIVISVFIFAVCIGPPLGGVFTQKVTWRWCFWINLPLGGVVLAGLTLFLKVKGIENADRKLPLMRKLSNMDPLGCVIFIGSICCLLLALQWGGQSKPWNSSVVIGLLVGFVTLTILFCYIQWKRGNRALIPLRVFCKRSIWTGALVLFFLGASTYLNVFFLPFYFQSAKGVSPIASGEDIIPFLASQLVALIAVGAAVKAWGHYVPYMVAGELICIVGTAFLTQLHPSTKTVVWAAYLVVAGIGKGMAMQLPYTAVQVVLDDDDIPSGNAIAVFFYQLGGAIAISMGQTITVTTLVNEVPKLLPGTRSGDVIAAGASNLLSLSNSPATLATLRNIWNLAISRTMILSVSLVAASVPCTLGMEWLNAKKIAEEKKRSAEVENDDKDDDKDDDIKKTVSAGDETLLLRRIEDPAKKDRPMSNRYSYISI